MELKFCKICKIVSTCYIKKRDVKIRGISLKIFPLLVFKLFNIKILSVSLRFMRFIVGESRFTSDLREREQIPNESKGNSNFSTFTLSLSLSRGWMIIPRIAVGETFIIDSIVWFSSPLWGTSSNISQFFFRIKSLINRFEFARSFDLFFPRIKVKDSYKRSRRSKSWFTKVVFR